MIGLYDIISDFTSVDKVIYRNKIEPHTEFIPEEPFRKAAKEKAIQYAKSEHLCSSNLLTYSKQEAKPQSEQETIFSVRWTHVQ